MICRRRIKWEAVDWVAYFGAGGVLTPDAWERATKASRAACLIARSWMEAADDDGCVVVGDHPTIPDPSPAPPVVTIADELLSLGVRR